MSDEAIVELTNKVDGIMKVLEAKDKEIDTLKNQVPSHGVLKASFETALSNMDEMGQARFRSKINASDDVAAKQALSEIPTVQQASEQPKDEIMEYLTQKHSAPVIEKMVNARRLAGATEEQLTTFQASLKDKNILEIEKLYQNEQVMIAKLEEFQTYEPPVETGADVVEAIDQEVSN